jgi:hypothetical protein
MVAHYGISKQPAGVGRLSPTLGRLAGERYPTDVSNTEWQLLEPHLPVPQHVGSVGL